ncbi:hypothetical protein [Anaerotignum sp.]
MDQIEIKRLLKITQEICEKKKEADATDLYKAAGITAAEANTFILKAEEENLADVIEIDMCCGADYIIKGLTEKGLAKIQE